MGPKRSNWVYVLRPRVKYPVFMIFNASYGKTEREGGLNVRAIDLLMEQAGFNLEGRTSVEKRDHLRLYFNEVVDAMHSPPPTPPSPMSPTLPPSPPPTPPRSPPPVLPPTPILRRLLSENVRVLRLPECWVCGFDCDEPGFDACRQCRAEMSGEVESCPYDPFDELGIDATGSTSNQ